MSHKLLVSAAMLVLGTACPSSFQVEQDFDIACDTNIKSIEEFTISGVGTNTALEGGKVTFDPGEIALVTVESRATKFVADMPALLCFAVREENQSIEDDLVTVGLLRFGADKDRSAYTFKVYYDPNRDDLCARPLVDQPDLPEQWQNFAHRCQGDLEAELYAQIWEYRPTLVAMAKTERNTGVLTVEYNK